MLVKDFFESLKKRYHYAMVVFKELAKKPNRMTMNITTKKQEYGVLQAAGINLIVYLSYPQPVIHHIPAFLS